MAIQTKVITINYSDTVPVLFQSKDAWINATAIAKQFGKKPETYLKTERTQDYIAALLKSMFGIENSVALKSATEQNQLVTVRKGGKPENQGTWFHPKLAIDFARWLNADFAVWCDSQVEKILHPNTNRAIEAQLKRDAHSIMMDAYVFARELKGLPYPSTQCFMNENLLCNEILTGKREAIDEDDLDADELKLLKMIRAHNGMLVQHTLDPIWRMEKLKIYADKYRAKKTHLRLVK